MRYKAEAETAEVLMRRILISFSFFIFTATHAFATEWTFRVDRKVTHADGSTTLVRPHRYGPFRVPVCGGPGRVDFGVHLSGNKICRHFGFKREVPGTLRTFDEAVLMKRVVMDRIVSGGWWCLGAPEGDAQGVRSIDCR